MLSEALLRQLADGRPHTRAELAQRAGLSDAGLSQQLALLTDAGLELAADTHASIALRTPIDWIDRAALIAAIGDTSSAAIARVDCLFQHASTNRFLLDAGAPPAGTAYVALAEFQDAGRGRRGRRWLMPPGHGIALSAAWRFDGPPAALSAFSLAVGAAVRRAIRDVTGLGVGLKWPNDLYVDGGKLGGILVEIEPLPAPASLVVAGVGINVRLAAAQRQALADQPGGVRDLAGILAGATPDRSQLAGAVIRRLLELFVSFPDAGFAPYRDEWSAAHVLDGQPVALHTGARTDFGIVRGIEDDGALIVENAAGQRCRHTAGDVTVRLSA